MNEENICKYDEVFVKSVVEEINEMLIERYGDEETVPILGMLPKDKIPCDTAIWVHIFKTADIKGKMKI